MNNCKFLEEKRRRDDSGIAKSVHHSIPSASGGFSLYVIPKRASQELERPRRLLAPFKAENLEQAHVEKLAST